MRIYEVHIGEKMARVKAPSAREALEKACKKLYGPRAAWWFNSELRQLGHFGQVVERIRGDGFTVLTPVVRARIWLGNDELIYHPKYGWQR